MYPLHPCEQGVSASPVEVLTPDRSSDVISPSAGAVLKELGLLTMAWRNTVALAFAGFEEREPMWLTSHLVRSK